ncbi:MAG: family N-acetyltransferase [Sphingomonas bacterium]|nr:family N-acetyltransferase [Sphingomonas bacterium]
MTATPLPRHSQIAARTLASLQRDLVGVPLSLVEAIEGRVPALPPLPRDAQGYLVTSLPEDRSAALAGAMIPYVRQRYVRHWVDLTAGFAPYWQAIPADTRTSVTRQTAKIACVSGGALDVRRCHNPDDLTRFHDVARRISLRTYQERMGRGMPDDATFLRGMYADAAAGVARGWLLYIAGEPAAYLYATIDAGTVIHRHAACDPAFADLAPGAVLQLEALRDLFAERAPKRFDFANAVGMSALASAGVPCVDLLLLRPSLANRAATVAQGTLDRAAALSRRSVERLGLERLANRFRREAH